MGEAKGNPLREFGTGAGLLGRGLGMWGRSPKLMLLGAVPALIAGALIVVGLGTLAFFAGDLAALVTPFADGWSSGARGFVRVLVWIAIVGVGVLLSVLVFTALTLAIGEPFYEKISAAVERAHGGAPGTAEVSLARAVVDSVRLVGVSLLVGVPLFLAGFLPLVGQTVVPVLGALVGGWLLAVEVTGTPFQRRGLRLRDRRRALARYRWCTLGFGVCVFLLFLIPFGAVPVMPAAVAGGTLLARRVSGEPYR